MEEYKLIENSSKVYFNGSEWDSNRHGKFKIIGKIDRFYEYDDLIKRYNYYLCKFEDGTIVDSDRTSIKNGSVRNPNNPIIHGIGYMGQGEWKCRINGEMTKEYRVWKGMLGRCYDGRFPTYDNIWVSKRWHCFQNFCEDIVNLDGYENWKNDKNRINEWQLDKDILCAKLSVNPKIYSKETCLFILQEDNEIEMQDRTKQNYLTGLTYIATRLSDNYTEDFINQSEFARKWNLNCSNIGRCIHNKVKQYKGWTFKIKE